MSPAMAAILAGLIRLSVTEFLAWRERRARDAAWVPSDADVDAFLEEISGDTPEKLKAKVAAELGIPWPPESPS